MVEARSPRQLRKQAPTRRVRHRHTTARRTRLSWRARGILAAVAVVAALLGWAVVARAMAPSSNTSLTRFDAIVVLGSPADSDGNPTPKELARVAQGVREYERGVAPRLIFSGGAVRNHFVEAQVMARAAEARGIPESAIFLEPEARDTIQNACFATRIMRAHGWRSAEVVSSAVHLPRAGILFDRTPLKWRVDAAQPLVPETVLSEGAETLLETLKTVHYLTYGSWAERCEP
ncbi:MAG: YdcF family protein [Acidobacteriota bacterium]|nr:YdcF family protein [Acidobacteriota bacterium]